jgi:hypothetical protein
MRFLEAHRIASAAAHRISSSVHVQEEHSLYEESRAQVVYSSQLHMEIINQLFLNS